MKYEELPKFIKVGQLALYQDKARENDSCVYFNGQTGPLSINITYSKFGQDFCGAVFFEHGTVYSSLGHHADVSKQRGEGCFANPPKMARHLESKLKRYRKALVTVVPIKLDRYPNTLKR